VAHGPAFSATAGDLSWNLRPEIVLPLLTVSGLYSVGAWRLARRGPVPALRARLALALGSLAVIALALVSPLDRLADRFFVAHMLQHMLLIMVAVPALLLADPFPILLWGLPDSVRRRARSSFARSSRFARAVRILTAMPLAWIVYGGVLWLWHLPAAYDRAVADRVLHDAEHVTFVLGAVLFWWPVLDPAPRVRPAAPHALRVVHLVVGAFQTAALGLVLTLAPVGLYRAYTLGPRLEGGGALDDQAWGGIVMWGLGGLIDMIALILFLRRCLDDRTPLGPLYSRAAAGASRHSPGISIAVRALAALRIGRLISVGLPAGDVRNVRPGQRPWP